jgi:hypothetical protein
MINMFKEPEEAMLKEIKENLETGSQQIQNIDKNIQMIRKNKMKTMVLKCVLERKHSLEGSSEF